MCKTYHASLTVEKVHQKGPMISTPSPRRIVKVSLDSIVSFDNEAILAAKNSDEACRIAEHLLARLEKIRAPRRYFELALKNSLMKRPEMQKRHYFIMHDRSVLKVAVRFGRHATTKTREKLITIAGYFGMYRLLKEVISDLRNTVMTKQEFLAMTVHFSVSSETMDEHALGMIRDAEIAHGEAFAKTIEDALATRYQEWNELP